MCLSLAFLEKVDSHTYNYCGWKRCISRLHCSPLFSKISPDFNENDWHIHLEDLENILMKKKKNSTNIETCLGF